MEQEFIRLEEAWICVDCEAIFGLRATLRIMGGFACPACASKAIWPLMAWLNPKLPLPYLRVNG